MTVEDIEERLRETELEIYARRPEHHDRIRRPVGERDAGRVLSLERLASHRERRAGARAGRGADVSEHGFRLGRPHAGRGIRDVRDSVDPL